jgi:plastocyanin
MKTLIALLVLAVTLVPVACGGDDEPPSDARDIPTAVQGDIGVETTLGETDRGVATGGGGRVSRNLVGKDAAEIRIEAAPKGVAYLTEHVTVEAGEALLHFENPQFEAHDTDLETVDGELIADMETIGGGYADVPIKDLEPGEYVFYCSVPGHREAGMEGTLTVTG